MKTILSLITVFALAATSASAQEDVAAKVKEFIDAHQVKLDAFTKEIQAAPREEQAKIYREKYPQPNETAKQLEEIIKGSPEDPAVIDAVEWVLRNSRGKANPVITEVIVKHHIDNEKILGVAAMMGYNRSSQSRDFLKILMEKSGSKDVRGMALYSYASQLGHDDESADEYIELMEKFIEEHPDLESRGQNLAKTAEGKLFAKTSLKIGKEAPEIIGKDVDGNEMKLSDYRGKVVVIDFWGDW